MSLNVPLAGPVVLGGVATQLKQLMAAAELQLDAEQQASQVELVLRRCPIAAKLTTLRPYLRNVSADLDAAKHIWRDTLQAVLEPSTSEHAVEVQRKLPFKSDERLRRLDSVVVRAEQVRRVVGPAAAVGSRSAALCDACFSIASWMQHLDEVACAHCVIDRSAAMHALSRELVMPSLQPSNDEGGVLDNQSVNLPALWDASAVSEFTTGDRGEAYLKTTFTIVNHSSTCMQLEHLRIGGTEGRSCHTVDLTNTALLLPHTKARPSYSMYVLLVPLSQLYPAKIVFANATAGVDAVTLQACLRFAESGARQRFQPRWPKYEFTWRFREAEAIETATDTMAVRRGLWARLGF